MIESLQEFVDARGAKLAVDRQTAVIRGVKVLGLESRNGRSYLPEALTNALALYEGVKVNVNHPKGHPLTARDYEERIGVLRSVTLRDSEGLFADLHYNPKHALAEQLAWDAEHVPENVGLSHNVEARTIRKDERTVVEAILKVHSVDLVADPATTRSLFESASVADAGTGVCGLHADCRECVHRQIGSGRQPVPAEDQRLIAVLESLLAKLSSGSSRPQSREQFAVDSLFHPVLDPKSFAEAIR